VAIPADRLRKHRPKCKERKRDLAMAKSLAQFARNRLFIFEKFIPPSFVMRSEKGGKKL
jgi:hypothetical protein